MATTFELRSLIRSVVSYRRKWETATRSAIVIGVFGRHLEFSNGDIVDVREIII
ncbi:hypothetical protein Ab1vBOLIVR4_gp93 [Agrobacterium phage OLIVR4]|nr:hypothetical protein Ab1vBOLIVR4_gp93 [Agrobacterium phage OLIVR4]